MTPKHAGEARVALVYGSYWWTRGRMTNSPESSGVVDQCVHVTESFGIDWIADHPVVVTLIVGVIAAIAALVGTLVGLRQKSAD